ncbi:MAG: DUF5028 domain-containing protein [Coriobacteriaceae bacterium]|jgi:aspartyl-tRNA synthetase|nr:DUF5028 domain-containing protein [Coriobacteriaceae bacterium]
MRQRKRRLALALAALVLAGAVAFRVCQVNAGAVDIATEYHQMGEWVELEGRFFTSRTSEDTHGYSIRVNSAKLMSYNEFIRRYGTDKGHVKEGFDLVNVVDLEVEVRNVGSETGRIPLLPMQLVPERKNTYLIWNDYLWVENEPNSEGMMFLAIKTDTEYTTHIPFARNLSDGKGGEFMRPLDDTRFELLVSNMPLRTVIVVEAQPVAPAG